MRTRDLDQLRHDLKNVLSALHSGCLLVDRGLPGDADPELREFLSDMRTRVDHGFELLDEWQAAAVREVGPATVRSPDEISGEMG